MKTRDFFFNLPDELIAQKPAGERGESRLLVYERAGGKITHAAVADLVSFLSPRSLLVFNDSKVLKARLRAKSVHGGVFEVLLVRRPDPQEERRWQAVVKKAGRLKPGARLFFPEDLTATIEEGADMERSLLFSRPVDETYLERVGSLPLPPYIRREAGERDDERYQTVYAAAPGSVAAPTAGLHFTRELLDNLDAAGHARARITLHVGLGTFLPVRGETIEEHRMHREEYEISPETAALLEKSRAEGKKVCAVGTTSVRTLESAFRKHGKFVPCREETDIFIHPGYEFRTIDHLFTNFHTPESTLLMLVSAFAGREEILRVYEEAIRERYRFFSYGDAMLIL